MLAKRYGDTRPACVSSARYLNWLSGEGRWKTKQWNLGRKAAGWNRKARPKGGGHGNRKGLFLEERRMNESQERWDRVPVYSVQKSPLRQGEKKGVLKSEKFFRQKPMLLVDCGIRQKYGH